MADVDASVFSSSVASLVEHSRPKSQTVDLAGRCVIGLEFEQFSKFLMVRTNDKFAVLRAEEGPAIVDRHGGRYHYRWGMSQSGVWLRGIGCLHLHTAPLRGSGWLGCVDDY